jgi:dipeptidase E
MRLLLMSNSTNAGEEYLAYGIGEIGKFLGGEKVTVLFIPYAAVTFSYDEYEKKVRKKFLEAGHEVVSIHHAKDEVAAVRDAEAIVVGGGNTWHLLTVLQEKTLLEPVREKVQGGTPYVGWSAGSNLVCPTIKTTNDMPIIQPRDFNALGLIPFQINPHYLDANPEGHAGETREMRIREFLKINPDIYVAGLREGTMLRVEGEKVSLIGSRSLRLFREGMKPVELTQQDSLDFLLQAG